MFPTVEAYRKSYRDFVSVMLNKQTANEWKLQAIQITNAASPFYIISKLFFVFIQNVAGYTVHLVVLIILVIVEISDFDDLGLKIMSAEPGTLS
ncbi:hypothetical protein WN944_013181 [Citrus x changshan-huyou]|uniref:Uncharacterized protein n=1 Tax=Citrus x changshan-huyou TaxID=2935761 RepID=A0AAP0M646_9ROSI